MVLQQVKGWHQQDASYFKDSAIVAKRELVDTVRGVARGVKSLAHGAKSLAQNRGKRNKVEQGTLLAATLAAAAAAAYEYNVRQSAQKYLSSTQAKANAAQVYLSSMRTRLTVLEANVNAAQAKLTAAETKFNTTVPFQFVKGATLYNAGAYNTGTLATASHGSTIISAYLYSVTPQISGTAQAASSCAFSGINPLVQIGAGPSATVYLSGNPGYTLFSVGNQNWQVDIVNATIGAGNHVQNSATLQFWYRPYPASTFQALMGGVNTTTKAANAAKNSVNVASKAANAANNVKNAAGNNVVIDTIIVVACSAIAAVSLATFVALRRHGKGNANGAESGLPA